MLILVNRKLNLTIEHLGSDEKGRFVFIRCKIYNNRLALVSIYGPNETDSAFLTQISKTLLEEIDCPLVVGGDFNAVINPAVAALRGNSYIFQFIIWTLQLKGQ